ncbi:Bud4p [Sugiyamaella lignohabitans]|uniref:Bud4p n=1 Tax=Sugiyamaella lignohabitans TaxID=796027 RepID=A0A167FHN9_9ASCO|nr:Bud4p [Sugiyamaella lignohabitans]ANB15311.1 Bud4p [Sugiyamaella lignohabitans]
MIEKKAKFNLTLDNGIHCITTGYTDLKRTSFLDEEFELTVGEELEFILSMKTKWVKQPTVVRKVVPAPNPVVKTFETKSRHGISKLFTQKRRVATPESAPQPVVQENIRNDNWESLVAADGSFARAYIDFSQYEKEIFGKPGTFELSCFNEWAKTASKSKRAPYKIGTLQVQLMFVPRASPNEILPTSIKQALEELKRTKPTQKAIKIEGYLSQLGGDCKYWRRRFFILEGTTLTAHSEASKKPRATINLAKAVQVVEDKSSLTKPVVQVGSNRRKSAFAETEAGASFVDQGFRIQFGNGEMIDFYADTAEEKSEWILGVEKSIKQSPQSKSWVSLVHERDRSE